MYINKPMTKSSGASQNVSFLCVQISQNIDGFRQSNSQSFYFNSIQFNLFGKIKQSISIIIHGKEYTIQVRTPVWLWMGPLTILEFIKLYLENLFREVFIFTIYQNYTLALSPHL